MTPKRLYAVLAPMVLFCAATVAFAAEPAPNPAACKTVEFSQDVLERFPRAPEACLNVISVSGDEYAVFKARLDRVTGNTVRVRFKLPDGSLGQSQNITTSPDFRVLIDGKPTRVSDLALGQDLTAYVKVQEPVLALQPAVETETLYVVPLAAPDQQVASAGPTMPDTASALPLLGMLGLLSIVSAAILTAARRLRR